MIPVLEIRKELEKNGSAVARPIIDFVKRHKMMTAGTMVGIPIAVGMMGHMLAPYMAIQQGRQLRTARDQLKNEVSQLRLEDQQLKMLSEISRSVKKPEEPRMRIEPLA